MVLMVDPPSGWKYGFPRPCPKEVWEGDDNDFSKWLIENGYPAKDVEFASKYIRCWEEKEKEENNS